MIEPLYHQTIKGAKTQTRRSGGLEVVNENPDDWVIDTGPFVTTKEIAKDVGKGKLANRHFLFINSVRTKVWCKPRYKVGEVLYIKEPIVVQGKRAVKDINTGNFIYRYDYPNISTNYDDDGSGNPYKYSNKLFMPASAARAFIRITGIKCERLLHISDEDCIAEGIETGWYETNYNYQKQMLECITPQESFISLYKFANKVKEVPNIWVFCYEFEYLPNYKLS